MSRIIIFYLIFQSTMALGQSHWSIVAQDSAGFDDIHFISLDTGFVVGTQNTAWRTTDGGSTWLQMELPSNIKTNNCELASLSFPNNRVGYIAGFTNTNPDSGLLLRTTDAGNTWQQLRTTPPYPIRQVVFPTPAIGFLTMWIDTGFIAKTTDSGFTWSLDTAPLGSYYILVQFRDSVHGIFLERDSDLTEGVNELLDITSDGLHTWTRTRALNGYVYADISPVRDRIWCVAGEDEIYRTTDDGNSWALWKEYTTNQFRDLYYIVGLAFHDTLGYAFNGNLFKTTDAGLTWNYQFLPDSTASYAGTILNDSVAYLLCESSVGQNIHYVILKTTDGGGPTISSGVSSNPPHSGLFLYANYPDPITSHTTISFTLPEASQVTLTLTDAAGRETPLLPAQYLSSGQHEVTWDAGNYPTGVYLCRLWAGGQSATRRVVVMH